MSAAPTPKELILRLRDVYEAKSDDDLARQLGVKTRSIGHWKAGSGMEYHTTVDLLYRAGWLSTDEPQATTLAQERREAALLAEAERLAAEAKRRRPST